MDMRLPASLHRPAAICGALLMIGLASLWLSLRAVDDGRTALALAAAKRQQATDLLLRTRAETDAIRQAFAHLAALRLTAGTDGAQGWHGALAKLQGDPRLFAVAIRERGGATRIPGPEALPTGRVQGLTAEIELLHEEGLPAILEVLSETHVATVIPLGCSIERLVSTAPALRAHCEFDWLTVHPAITPSS